MADRPREGNRKRNLIHLSLLPLLAMAGIGPDISWEQETQSISPTVGGRLISEPSLWSPRICISEKLRPELGITPRDADV